MRCAGSTGEWGRLRQGVGRSARARGASGPVRCAGPRAGRSQLQGRLRAPAFACCAGRGGVVPARPRPRASLPAYFPSRLKTWDPRPPASYSIPACLQPLQPFALFPRGTLPAAPGFFDLPIRVALGPWTLGTEIHVLFRNCSEFDALVEATLLC